MDNIIGNEEQLKKVILFGAGASGNCIVKKGYSPGSANGVDDSFAFVNLDVDLYQPL